MTAFYGKILLSLYVRYMKGCRSMSSITWSLVTLDATKILRNLSKKSLIQRNGNYRIDFRYNLFDKNSFARDIILSEDYFADNALFFQLRKVFPEDSDLTERMRSSIVFVDFKEVFKKNLFTEDLVGMTPSKADLLSDDGLIYRLKQLFEDGLWLNFDGRVYKRFVPFDKSSSMARNCQITFIDSGIKDVLDGRLMLDMNFLGKPLALSKFYAYRGLYLSNAFRIELDPQKNFSLNEESVIVLPDDVETLNQNVFTAFKRDDLWEYKTCDKTLKLKLFDGEGLIAPDFAKHLSDVLRVTYHLNAPSHSFQVRLPFTKGVLHDVDFDKFFLEQLPQPCNELIIRDIFGVTRDLRKAKIILTKSMFKCADWMMDLKSLGSDPMKYFFEKFAEYDHAIYVTNTEARLANPGRVKLNYQFLSTLALTPEDFDELVCEQRKRVDSFGEDFVTAFDSSNVERNSEDDFADEQGDDLKVTSLSSRTTCLNAVKKNSAFLRDPKVKSIYSDLLKNYECDFGLGRLEVVGEQRFLSCDLLVLLIHILKNVENVSLDDAQKNFLRKQCLYPNRFFMAENKISLKPDKQYAFLRNPHLSRNEQVLLRSYINHSSLHEKYFSQLRGVVMISARSTAAMSLGGADFDGDLVKVVADPRIVEAVKRGNSYSVLSPIEIPSANSKRLPLGYSIPLSVILDTFSNQVGEISNWAVKLASKEYFSPSSAKDYKDACAKCTIVVGLEIDAAKSGIHPKENIDDLQKLARNSGTSFFLDMKKNIGKILRGNYSPVVVQRDETLTLYFSAKAKEVGLSTRVMLSKETDVSILERLPVKYLQLILEHDFSTSKLTTNAPSLFFNFEDNPDWRKTLDEEKRAELFKLVKAYLHILSLDRRTRFIKNATKEKSFHGHILNLLDLQYDDRYQKLSCGVEVAEALNQLYAELLLYIETLADVKAALNSLKEERWHCVAEQDRPRVAAKILGLDSSAVENLPDVFELLYNFRCNGFMLFYYALKELQARLFDETEVLSELEKADDDGFKKSSCYKKLYEIYLSSVAEKKSKAIWNAQLIKVCRQSLHEIFGDDLCEALKYYWSNRSKDSVHNFLWNVFTAQEIFSQVYVSKIQG